MPNDQDCEPDPVRSAMAAKPGKVSRSDGNADTLHAYWVHGEGAAKIRWGSPGDFDRCVSHLGKYLKDPKGYCNLAHHAATGMYPATHAKQEKVTRSEPMSHDSDGLDASWDGDLADLPDLTGLDVPDFEAITGDTPASGVSRAAPALGSGARFKALKGKLAAKGASDPGALAAYIGRKKFGKGKFAKLASSARKRKGGGMARSAVDWREITRDVPVEDIHIMRTAEGDGSGRVVEAYAAVFEQPTDIDNHQGKYREVIDRSAFSDTLVRIGSRRGGLASALRVLYNHGKTMEGVPAPEFQQPLGRPVFVEADSRGLLTRTEYARTPLAENTLELIRAGAITTQSFVGGIIRSEPALRGPGDEYRPRNGMRQTVRRIALGLREYGPVLWAAYTGAEILGVRSQLPSPDELDVQPGDEDEFPDPDGELAGVTPEEVIPSRSHAHRLWQIHYEDMAGQAGIIRRG